MIESWVYLPVCTVILEEQQLAAEKIGMLTAQLCGSEKERDEAKLNMECTNALLGSRIQLLESKLQGLEAEHGLTASSEVC